MSSLAAAESTRLRRGGAPATARRKDIDGLRALAVLLVVVYHVWTQRVSGGVDVFLLISAYFLTGSFVRSAEREGQPSLARYWATRFRRLLPAVAVTLLGTLALAALVYPPSTWAPLWRQTWASLFYIENWELATTAVDYYARDAELASPLQHFWSLSVQGQVFVLWPILIVGGVYAARRLAWSIRLTLVGLFGVIFAASLVYSIVTTASNQAFAYFDTAARLWEFALGSLLALLSPWLRLPRPAAILAGWFGLVALVLCGLLLDVRGGFPGYLALWPTLAACVILLAGNTVPIAGVGLLLSTRPLQRLATISYALYLVHWPVLITFLLLADTRRASLAEGAVVIVVSLVLAFLVTYGVERPIQRRSDGSVGRSLRTIGVCVGAVVLPLASWQIYERVAPPQINPGASVLYDPEVSEPRAGTPLQPSGADLETEWVSLGGACAGEDRPRGILEGSCLQSTVDDSGLSVLVVGDSHAQQWMGALEPAAERNGWNVTALLKAGCSFADGESPLPGVEFCEEWRTAVVDYAVSLRPDVIMLMGTKSQPDSRGERALRGIESTVDQLGESGARIVALRDNPRFADDIFRCVEESDDPGLCARERRAVLPRVNPAAHLSSAGVVVVDLTEYLCPDDVCRAVIGGVVVYLDDNHLTRSYARTLSPLLEDEILQLTG